MRRDPGIFLSEMTDAEQLTTDNIQRIIDVEEIPYRRRDFTPEAIEAVLRYGAVVGSAIEHRPRISRGSDLARQFIRAAEEKNESFCSGTVILADEMVASKGRFNRYWHAPVGGLWLTLALANTLLPESSLLLPMAAGVACCEVVRHYKIPAHIKWVNDTQVNNRKISGILTETFTGLRFGEEYVLIGIGINVNNDIFPSELGDRATSMKSCLGHETDLAAVTARLLAKLRWNIGLLFYAEEKNLEKHGGIALSHETEAEESSSEEHPLLQRYKNLSDIFNRRVVFGFNVQTDPQFEARVIGLDHSGGLILELADSSTVIQHSGEIVYLD